MKEMKKLLLNAFCVMSLCSAMSVHAETVELWNKSKTPFYIALLDHEGNYILPAQHRGEKADSDKAIQLQEFKYSDKKDKAGRISLNDQIFDNKHGTYLLVSDKSTPQEREWKGILGYKFSPGKDIFVRIKDSVTTLDQLSDNGFGPQTGPFKGLKGRTETGLSLKNNVKARDVTRLRFGAIWPMVFPKKARAKELRDRLTEKEIQHLHDFFGLKEDATLEDLNWAYKKITEDEGLTDAMKMSRTQHARADLIRENYTTLATLLDVD